MNQSSLLRDVVGFVVGGLTAAVAAALIFLAFFPLPSEPKRTDHTGEALAMLVLVMLFCGGFIGRRGFSADFISDLVPPVIGSYVAVIGLCVIAGLSLGELAPMVGFASVGIITSAVVSLALLRWFPPKPPNNEV